MSNCETCLHYEYDEEYDCYYCGMELDMDEQEKFMTARFKACPFYNPGDEYSIVKKQN